MRQPYRLLRVRWTLGDARGSWWVCGAVCRGATRPDWTDPVVDLLFFHPHPGGLPERPMGVDCKSIAKASKARILHPPLRAERASDLRKRRSEALSLGPAVTGSPWLSTAVRPEYARKLRLRPALQAPWSAPAPPVCAAVRSHPGHI